MIGIVHADKFSVKLHFLPSWNPCENVIIHYWYSSIISGTDHHYQISHKMRKHTIWHGSPLPPPHTHNKDSNQPAHLRCLITVCMKKLRITGYKYASDDSARIRRLIWIFTRCMSEGTFSDIAAHNVLTFFFSFFFFFFFFLHNVLINS